MIQVYTASNNTEEDVNNWLADRQNSRYQVLEIQYVMGSEYGRTSAMIIYEDDPNDDPLSFVQMPRLK